MARVLTGIGWTLALAAALWATFRTGVANWDTDYALVWGSEVARGASLDWTVALEPTSHPLADLLGLVLSPLGADASSVVVAIGFLALGAIGYLTYQLGATLFGRLVGLAAAVIVLTREPMLDYGVRAYVDLVYVALVLGALLVEARRPKAGWPVLTLLAVAGLLRPEAWLFSLAYLAYLASPWQLPARETVPPPAAPPATAAWRAPRRLLPLTAIALAAPLLWILFDWVSSGDPLASLSGTRDNVATLGRATGLDALVTTAPRRLGEILREPGLLAAMLGLGVGIAWLRRRSAPLLAALGLAVVAFALLAIADLPVITRYLLLIAALLCVFGGVAIGGWRLLPSGTTRTAAIAAAALSVLAFLALVPRQVDRLVDLRERVAAQQRVADDLEALAEAGAFPRACGPIAVASSRPVPLLALWLDRSPSSVLTPADGLPPTRGVVLLPTSRRVADDFELDPRDPGIVPLHAGPGYRLRAANRSWRVYARCV